MVGISIRKQRQKEHNKSAIEDDDELADWIEEYTIEADNDQNMQDRHRINDKK